MDNIGVSVRLRPIRFAFLVGPDDGPSLKKVFQINTCLWGGAFNPIVPVFKRVPKWWERQGYKFENAQQIVNGYLDFFEPDFLVEAKKGLSIGLGFDPERALQLNELLTTSNDREGHGLSVLDLYRKLYKDEFQFERRHKQKTVSVTPEQPKFAAFSGCLFGDFPKEKSLKYFGRGFKDVFDPETVKLNANSLQKLYHGRFFSPLRMGRDGLEVDYHSERDPTLFILDAEEPRDLIDFWNFRAVNRSVVAIPVQWLPELSSFCRDFITKNHRPLPGNPHGVMIHVTSMFSRSIPESKIEELHAKFLRVNQSGANILQTWYPPIWRPSPKYTIRTTRPTVTASSKKFNVSFDVDKPQIRFESLNPEFAERFGSEHRWANVIRFEDWSYKDRVATVFPTDFRKQAVPRFGLGGEHLICSNEGLINFPKYKDIPNHWELIDGKSAVELWLKQKQIKCQLSGSGRATEQIIQTLGGFWGVRSIASKGVIDLLDEMSRRPLTRSMIHREFQNKVGNAVGKERRYNKTFESLIERRAVELGYEAKCKKCGSWSWYALGALTETLKCELCLRDFKFPITNPYDVNSGRWAYRVIGPFALPRYADGGYAASLAIRFFSDVLGRAHSSECTWAAGHELTLSNGKKAESDFMLWYQRKRTFGTDYPAEMIFGEAKSFGKDSFQDEDVERMKLMGMQFPCSVLVFATMKEASDLSKAEVRRIRALAQWGREYDRDRRRLRATVVVLTGTELFADDFLEHTWKEKGGKHSQIAGRGHLELDDLEILADFTQQLYLGMPSYSSWLDAKWKKKRSRKR